MTKDQGIFTPPANKPNHQRTKLERAGCIALAMELSHRTMWSLWPHQLCANTCLLLAPAIRMALGWDVRLAVGSIHQGRFHVWIQSPEHDIIDPTAGQFDGGPALRILPALQSEVLNHFAIVVLTLDQEEELRRSLRPASSATGWSSDTEIFKLRDLVTASPSSPS